MWKLLKRLLKRIFRTLLIVVVVLAAVSFGPDLLARFFLTGNTQWISERFSEELKEKSELVVLEIVLTGQETASQEAWLVGTVQEVRVPYSYSIHFSVDLSQSVVESTGNTIEIRLPPPQAGFSKLTVDEQNMQRRDWLYPLTPEHYADIKAEIEQKLYDECAGNPAYLERARAAAEEKIKALFVAFAEAAGQGAGADILVVVGDTVS